MISHDFGIPSESLDAADIKSSNERSGTHVVSLRVQDDGGCSVDAIENILDENSAGSLEVNEKLVEIGRENFASDPAVISPNESVTVEGSSSERNSCERDTQIVGNASDENSTGSEKGNEKFVATGRVPLSKGFITELPDRSHSSSDDEEEIVWHQEPVSDIFPLRHATPPSGVPEQALLSPITKHIGTSRREVVIDSNPSKAKALKSKVATCPYDSFDMIFCAAYGPDGGSRYSYCSELLRFIFISL